MRSIVRFGRLMLIALMLSLIPMNTPTTQAFENDETGHPAITEEALQNIKAPITGGELRFSRKAIQDVIDANVDVDHSTWYVSGTDFYHFDNETLSLGSGLLVSRRKEIIDLLKQNPPNGQLARNKLGQAFHTLQDFFAHSNWVELDQLGRARRDIQFGQTILDNPPLDRQFCSKLLPSKLVDSGLTELTTGYFALHWIVSPDRWYIERPGLSGKCAHGKVLLPGISKDGTGDLHDAAFREAKAASTRFVNDILEEPGIKGNDKAIRALLTKRSSLVFVVDVSTSMQDDIDQVKAGVQQIVQGSLKEENLPEEYVLITFSDPVGIGSGFISSDPNAFLAEVNAIQLIYSDNPDCPEFSMNGVADAIEASSTNANIFVFTDADAKDSELSSNVDRAAKEKGSRISYLLSGTCSFLTDSAYIRTANTTGGQIYHVDPEDLGQAFKLIGSQIESDFTPYYRGGGFFPLGLQASAPSSATAAGTQTFAVPIDSTTTRATFSITVDTKQSLELRRPSGTVLAANDPGVTFTELDSGWVVTVDAPESGVWNLTIKGSGAYSVSVGGNSPISFDAFDFVEQTGIEHEGLFPIAGQPIVGTTPIAQARVLGSFSTVAFSIVSESGTTLQPLTLAPESSAVLTDTFSGVTAQLPAEPFRVAVNGVDAAGQPFQRIFPRLFQAQTVQLALATPLTDTDFLPGQMTTISVTVQNLGAANTFHVTVNDSLGSAYPVEPTDLTLASGATGVVQVDVAVPLHIISDTEFKLTAAATSTSSPNVANSAALNVLLAPLNHTYLPITNSGGTTASPTTVYVDTFSDPSSGWYEGERNGIRWGYRANQYEMVLQKADIWAGSARFSRVSLEHTVEADMQRRSGDTSFYGLVVGFNSWADHYLFLVDPTTQSYSVWQRGSSLKQIIPWTPSSDIHPGNTVNKLGVQRLQPGNVHYNVFINGKQQNSFEVAASGTGVGVYAQTLPGGSVPTTLRYDNFRVTYQTDTVSNMATAGADDTAVATGHNAR